MRAVAIDQRAQATPEQRLRHLRKVSHIALKGHLLVEESLGRIIAQHCRAASVLDDVKITFYVKTKLARALVGDLHGTALWVLVWKLYLIHTDFVHKVESPGVRRLIKNLIEAKSRWAEESLPAIANDDQLATRFADSIQCILGALAAIEMRVRENAASGGGKSLTGNEVIKQVVPNHKRNGLAAP
jgi:hypothetical protein